MVQYDRYSASVKELINKLYCYHSETDPLARFDNLEKVDESQLYSSFMKLLCELDMTEEEARYHYGEITKHTLAMEEVNKRPVGFRVSMLDYLTNINPRLTCPKFIELNAYAAMLEQSTIDGLTGVYNRRYFESHLDREIHRSSRHTHTFSLILLDLDNFKSVNDTYGHIVGDTVLKEFSGLVKSLLRTEDLAARFGGEEFILLLPQTEIEGARIFTQRLLDKTRSFPYGHGNPLTFSGGISNFPLHARAPKELINIADKGLYAAKLRGKNSFSIPRVDRRDCRRYVTDARLSFIAGSDTMQQGKIRNISITGLAGETEFHLRPGQVITIEFRNSEESMDYQVHAQIVWINQYAESDPYLFGAKYSDYSPQVLSQVMDQVVPDGPERDDEKQPDLF